MVWHLPIPVHNCNTICLSTKLRIRRMLLFFMCRTTLDYQILLLLKGFLRASVKVNQMYRTKLQFYPMHSKGIQFLDT